MFLVDMRATPPWVNLVSRRMILVLDDERRGDEIEFYHVASAWESKTKLLACDEILDSIDSGV